MDNAHTVRQNSVEMERERENKYEMHAGTLAWCRCCAALRVITAHHPIPPTPRKSIPSCPNTNRQKYNWKYKNRIMHIIAVISPKLFRRTLLKHKHKHKHKSKPKRKRNHTDTHLNKNQIHMQKTISKAI